MLPYSHSTIDHEKIAPWTMEQDITPSVHDDEMVSLEPLIFSISRTLHTYSISLALSSIFVLGPLDTLFNSSG